MTDTPLATNISKTNITNAEIDWSDAGIPHSTAYDDIYFSTIDAPGESEYVFLAANKLKQRWSNTTLDNFVIAECGFGSGLNFLSTCKLWCETSPPNAHLFYIACELHPFLKNDLQRLHLQWPHLSSYSMALLKHYPDHSAGLHRLHLKINSKLITLDLLYGDAAACLGSLSQTFSSKVNAWYLDGFSPRLNPKMWSPELFRSISRLSASDCSLSTYSAAGEIKRGLRAVGFTVKRYPGFGRKRHMLCASFTQTTVKPIITTNSSISASANKPWYSLPTAQKIKKKKVIIIGAGLAGCATAYSLAKKGWSVTLLERKPEIATMASGNPQGIVYCKHPIQTSASSLFTQQAYLYAIRQYQTLAQHHDINWQQCGMIQLAYNAKERNRQQAIINNLAPSPRLCQSLSASQVDETAKVAVELGGLFFPSSGWLSPRLLCQAYCNQPGISIVKESNALQLLRKQTQWQVICESTTTLDEPSLKADAVIIANSIDAESLSFSKHYPLIPNTGQVDFYSESKQSKPLATILCSNAYILPAHQGIHSIGGSFIANQRNTPSNRADKQKNLELLNTALPKLTQSLPRSPTTLASRTATRCSTPDYLPIVGPVENVRKCKVIYSELAKNAKKELKQPPEFETNLYINVAHGSHGLTTTALSGEYIASMLNHDPLPLQQEIVACLHPIRFLMRDLKRQI